MNENIKDRMWRVSSAIALLFIMLYPIGAYCLKQSTGFSYIVTSMLFALPVVVVSLLISRKWLYVILVSLITILSLIELTTVEIYNSYLLPGGIISTLWTNPQEASEFYDTNLKVVWHWLPLLLLSVFSIETYRKPIKYKYKYVLYILLALAPVAYVSYKLLFFYNTKPENGLTLRYYLDNRVWNRPPYNIVHSSIGAYKLLEQRKMLEQAQYVSFGAHRNIEPNQKEVYVLAIGESLRYENFSLNGTYARTTTPRLEAMDNIILFDNYYSQACLTMLSVPMLLTRATPTNYELNYAEPTIAKAYKECGFSTYVIANKTNLLAYEPYLSNGSDSLIIVPNIVQDGEILSGDRTIVHVIDSLMGVHDKLFVICQFLGNHSFYTNYEKDFDIYHPNSNDPGIGYTKEALTNAYDNSILYTDYILSSIAQVIDRDNTCSAMMFVSDHGEDICEGGGGHGGNCAPVKDEYHVPFIYCWNDNYAIAYPEKIEVALSHKQSKINGDVIFYSACSMADIKIDSIYAQPTYDVLSSDFQEYCRLILVPDGASTVNPDK